MFTRLCIYSHRDTSWLGLGAEGIRIGAELFEGTKRQKEVIPRVFSVCGASITVIEIYGRCFRTTQTGTGTQSFFSQTVSLVLQYCRNVREVFFFNYSPPVDWEQARAIFDEYAHQLHSIYLPDTPDFFDIQANLFVPDFSACSNIKSFTCSSIHSERMILLLQSFGEKLESLSISLEDSNGYTALLDVVQDKCTQLNSFNLGHSRDIIWEVGEDRYSSFICSFGEKLISTELHGMSDEHVKEIIRICSKLELRFYHGDRTLLLEDWEYLDTIAPCLVDLSIASNALVNEECLNTMAKCSNIRSLPIGGTDLAGESPVISDEAMMNVFSCSSFHVLEFLSLKGFTVKPQNVALIASKTSQLGTVEFGVRGTVENGNVFKQLVDSNPNLCSIHVTEDENCEPVRNFDSTTDTLRELMEAFSVCEMIDISMKRPQECEMGVDKVREICGYVRCRGIEIHIRVGGTVYKQTDYPHGG